MDHQDHVNLLRTGVTGPGGVWADFGSGDGAFTLALAELIGPTGQIYSLDKHKGKLRRQEQAMQERFPDVVQIYLQTDFTKKAELPALDGLVMANSLHFIRNKERVVRLLRSYLKPGGRFLLVEYNTDRGNPWVPHPLSFVTWVGLARQAGFERTELLSTVPSRFLGEIYAAASYEI
jgi:ubiquinone/menaquinone biosynthesis C-methylase UbiE